LNTVELRAAGAGEGVVCEHCEVADGPLTRLAIFLDSGLQVVGVTEKLCPWRTAGRRGARAVLELRAGEARRLGVIAGLQLEVAGTPSGGSQRARSGSHGS
jgi:hypothetical protein